MSVSNTDFLYPIVTLRNAPAVAAWCEQSRDPAVQAFGEELARDILHAEKRKARVQERSESREQVDAD